jgi:hypothetical protein
VTTDGGVDWRAAHLRGLGIDEHGQVTNEESVKMIADKGVRWSFSAVPKKAKHERPLRKSGRQICGRKLSIDMTFGLVALDGGAQERSRWRTTSRSGSPRKKPRASGSAPG